MTFPARTSYGLVALLELAALHGRRDDGVLRAGEIARRQGIPERYLEQMLASLRRGGFLCSLRGPRGGYRLARAPERIRLDEVVRCLEGGAPTGGGGCGGVDEGGTPEARAVAGLEASLAELRRARLADLTLAQLLRERDLLGAAPVMYFI